MRPLLIAVVAALLIGGGIGFAIGRSSAPEPSPAQIASDLRPQLGPVREQLADLPATYRTDPGAATEAITDVEKRLSAAAPDLRALTPRGVERLSLALGALKQAVAQKAKPAQVQRLTDDVTEIVVTLPGGY